MADGWSLGNQGRGGRGGRGRGGRGRGEGAPRGGAEGAGRGGGRGPGPAQGFSDDRGRGGYRGGRGGPRGGGSGFAEGSSSQSFGGDRGGRGRGRGGDRGRGGGRGRGGSYGPPADREPVAHLPADCPAPSAEITELENRLEKTLLKKSTDDSLTGALSKLTLSPLTLPVRPGFGTEGRKVKLWANYFKVDLNPKTNLYVYNVEVTSLKEKKEKKDKKEKAEGNGKGKEKATESPGPSGSGLPEADNAVKGARLQQVMQAAMAEIEAHNKGLALASELKAKLVASGELVWPAGSSFEINLAPPEDPRPDRYMITLEGPRMFEAQRLVQYLQDMQDTDVSYPKFEDSVDTLNVVLGYSARQKVQAVGSKRFFQTSDDPAVAHPKAVLMEKVLAICRGYFQSLRLSTGRLLLNTNVTHGVFRLEAEVVDIFKQYKIDRNDRECFRDLYNICHYLKRARVEHRFKLAQGSEMRAKQKTMHGIVESHSDLATNANLQVDHGLFPGPKQVRFRVMEGADSKLVSVYDYYNTKYDIEVNANWPLLNMGTRELPSLVPAEYCKVLSSPMKVKLDAFQSDAMIKFACRSPANNYMSIMEQGRALLCHESPLLTKFGLSIDKKMLTVQGRELLAPQLTYQDGKGFDTKGASWNLMGKRFVQPGKAVKNWACVGINLRADEATVRETALGFRKQAMTQGIIFSDNPNSIRVVKMDIDTRKSPAQVDQQLAGKLRGWAENLDMLLVFIPRKEAEPYGAIKRVGDTILGIHTVCMTWRHSYSPMHFGNIALKWNLKLNGTNHRLERDQSGLIDQGKTMIVGYDVTHPTNAPTPAAAKAPSIVGLVASIDKHVGQWPAVAWVHNSKVEVCEDAQLKMAFESRLALWLTKNKELPENIIIYRDGVSEGQFSQVLALELPRIRAACQAAYGPRKQKMPKISIIVSVKRHHTRFYPSSSQGDVCTRSGNIKPGTVVDRGVTQARYWDFFLTAHDSLQGTARPAHYTVLLDEVFRGRKNRSAVSDLERLTYDLCYMFGRATRAVSICPPAYYADIVCERARIHRATLSTQQQSQVGKIRINDRLKDSMYYI